MAKKPEEFDRPAELEDFYVSTAEFPAGFMTAIRAVDAHRRAHAPGPGHRVPDRQALQVGAGRARRDTNPLQLGHQATADGRWRIYVFADAARPGRGLGRVADVDAEWLANAPDSPLAATPEGADLTPGST